MKEKRNLLIGGGIVGAIAVALVMLGNPKNMGFCIACFIRDIAGGLGLHGAAVVQYIRPEVIGLVCGAFIVAVLKKDFAPRGGSSPLTRFVLGFGVMVGALIFLGCPLRMALRIAGGDLNAVLLTDDDDPFGETQPGISMDADFRNLYTEEIERFSLAVVNGTAVDIPPETALEAQKVIDAAYESSRRGKIIAIDH